MQWALREGCPAGGPSPSCSVSDGSSWLLLQLLAVNLGVEEGRNLRVGGPSWGLGAPTMHARAHTLTCIAVSGGPLVHLSVRSELDALAACRVAAELEMRF